MENFTTYAAVEKQLISNGYSYKEGTPLTGCIFKNDSNIAVIIRMGNANYEISYYEREAN